MQNRDAFLKEKQHRINAELKSLILGKAPSPSDRLTEAMLYSVMAGGKRIRPILCLTAFEALGGEITEPVLQASCTFELVHTYSLIHDDLPAMDDDDVRRGKPTCHVQFDEATAILAGDALLTHAFYILSQIGCSQPVYREKALQVSASLSFASGHMGMVMGQVLDLENERKIITREELEQTHRLKTGALIQAAVVSGGILAGGNRQQLDCLERYADSVGLAFQVADDILNVEGNPELMGKAVGTDLERQKCTYPSLMGMDASKKYARQLVNNALHAISQFDTKADSLRDIASFIINRNQ